MKIEITETHKGVIIENPTYEILPETVDNHIKETFSPAIIVGSEKSNNIAIYHRLPPQPYVNGTWGDEDVVNAVENHLKTLEIKE